MILVFRGPCADVGKGAEPVDAGIRAEVDEDDLSPQPGRRQWRRVEPFGRPAERGQLSFRVELSRCARHVLYQSFRRTEHAERSGGEDGGRSAHETAAIQTAARGPHL